MILQLITIVVLVLAKTQTPHNTSQHIAYSIYFRITEQHDDRTYKTRTIALKNVYVDDDEFLKMLFMTMYK